MDNETVVQRPSPTPEERLANIEQYLSQLVGTARNVDSIIPLTIDNMAARSVFDLSLAETPGYLKQFIASEYKEFYIPHENPYIGVSSPHRSLTLYRDNWHKLGSVRVGNTRVFHVPHCEKLIVEIHPGPETTPITLIAASRPLDVPALDCIAPPIIILDPVVVAVGTPQFTKLCTVTETIGVRAIPLSVVRDAGITATQAIFFGINESAVIDNLVGAAAIYAFAGVQTFTATTIALPSTAFILNAAPVAGLYTAPRHVFTSISATGVGNTTCGIALEFGRQ